jgi:UDP-N-acetylglucosamine--N-acetylmuramyl-(pentapeptide) pyrophosphoryl-undecaprenol N-acetylglucosamine transferase
VVATGGFVSGPAIISAGRAGLPTALVNLDAVPGKANRYLARRVAKVFSVYDVPRWDDVERIGMPVRSVARASAAAGEARRQLGLKPDRETLLICGGSQGAQSINDMMIELARRGAIASDWQVLHLSGPTDEAKLRAEYADCAIDARVTAFCDQMGLAWSAATLAISRAGAGGVAEVVVNTVPAVFMPYPFHKDQHQRLNALPLVESGGAVMLDDRVDAAANAEQMAPLLRSLLSDAPRRGRMAELLGRRAPPDGAATVARWVAEAADRPG